MIKTIPDEQGQTRLFGPGKFPCTIEGDYADTTQRRGKYNDLLCSALNPFTLRCTFFIIVFHGRAI